jgi:hypothetical protein
VISGTLVSSIQCKILLNLSTKEILFRDASSYRNTQVGLPNSTLSFSKEGVRQIVLRNGDSIHIAMGGRDGKLFQFEVVWPPSNLVKCERVEQLKTAFVNKPKKSRLAVTYEYPQVRCSRPESGLPACRGLEDLEPWEHCLVGLEPLGHGASGVVFKTVNMHTGNYYAVKRMWHKSGYPNDKDWRKEVLREVNTLSRLRHVSPHSAGRFHHHFSFQRSLLTLTSIAEHCRVLPRARFHSRRAFGRNIHATLPGIARKFRQQESYFQT